MNLILTGPPGVGKSSVGRRLADLMGRAFVDLDGEIERATGRGLPGLFAAEGEPGFRAHERKAVRALVDSAPTHTVIATGGWTCGDAGNRAALESLGPVICLTASADTLAARLAAGDAAPRPLLAAPEGGALARLLFERQPVYDSFPLQVDADGRGIETVVEHIRRLVPPGAPPALRVSIPVRAPVDRCGSRGARPGYGALVGAGLLEDVGRHLAARGLGERAVIVSDAHVRPLYGDRIRAALAAGGIDAGVITLPAGEATKSPQTVADLCERFAATGLDRAATVVALGGGVVGDVAGFAAAVYLRGVAWIAAPTSLLAMVDAAVGGKTGVNLAAGKNLVGAFKQPVVVAADPALLATLPSREIRAGLAEVVKAAVVADPGLFDILEARGAPARSDATAWSGIVARAVAVKAAIVGEDPGEHGRRVVLNLGHTFAHAFERASGYRVPHGEAVAIGLVAAARLAERTGAAEAPGLAERVEALVASLDLPVRWSGPDAGDVVAAMATDKKRRRGRLRFVLPVAIGAVTVADSVAEADVRAVVDGLRGL